MMAFRTGAQPRVGPGPSSSRAASIPSSSSAPCSSSHTLGLSHVRHVSVHGRSCPPPLCASSPRDTTPSTSSSLERLASLPTAALLAATLLLSPCNPVAMQPAWAAAPTMQQQADISQKAVEDYAEAESAGKLKNAKALDDFRARYRIRRSLDGRVQVKSSKGEWWSVRLDMEVPGALLLRDPSGNVFAVQTESLQQIDLSDDYVCLLMFADGAWEEQMSAVDFTDESGKTKQLKLDEKEFREVIGILKETAEEDEPGQGR